MTKIPLLLALPDIYALGLQAMAKRLLILLVALGCWAATSVGANAQEVAESANQPVVVETQELEDIGPASAEAMLELNSWLEQRLLGIGISEDIVDLSAGAILLVVILMLAVVANWIAKRIILRVIDQVVARTPWKWDNALRDNRVFTRLSHLAPAAVINLLGTGLFVNHPAIVSLISSLVTIYVIIVLLLVASAVINSIQTYLEAGEAGSGIPIKGFAQAIKLILFILGAILVLSVVFGKSPVYFLSGLGALTAVLLLVFRDALLGLVAGIMISTNQMVKIGDWIEMPGGADGDVIDVSLTTVKVQNWDRTITTIPSYDLISKSFKNWRGMFDSKGRRIKRSLLIDMSTVSFVDKPMLEKMLRIRRLHGYLKEKVKEIEKANNQENLDMDVLCNGRRLTNLGTFRAYCVAYLRSHPGIFQEETLLVRQLSPTEHGLPLEIYAFTNDTRWGMYEDIQSDIFDHLLSIVGEFGLKVFQDPSGSDMHSLLAEHPQAARTQAAEAALADGAAPEQK